MPAEQQWLVTPSREGSAARGAPSTSAHSFLLGQSGEGILFPGPSRLPHPRRLSEFPPRSLLSEGGSGFSPITSGLTERWIGNFPQIQPTPVTGEDAEGQREDPVTRAQCLWRSPDSLDHVLSLTRLHSFVSEGLLAPFPPPQMPFPIRVLRSSKHPFPISRRPPAPGGAHSLLISSIVLLVHLRPVGSV